MDTFRDKQMLDELEASGERSVARCGRTAVWRRRQSHAEAGPSQQRARDPFSVLCLGAHSDDIEIGCGGTLLYLKKTIPAIEVSLGSFQRVGNPWHGSREGCRVIYRRLRQGNCSQGLSRRVPAL